MTPHYKIVDIGGEKLVIFYPQFKDYDGYKIIDPENRFPIELKNHDEYMDFLETLIEREQELKNGLTTLADLIEEMDMLARGPKGDTRYMWVKYADDEQGNGMSDDPAGKKYIGMAFNKDEETPSDEPSDYKFVKYVADYEGLEIGGSNLNRDSNNFSYGVWTKYDGGSYTVTENISVEEWGATDATRVRASEGNGESVLKILKNITFTTDTVEGETYTISFYVKNMRDREMSVNVNGISPRPTVNIGANEAKRVVVTGERSSNSLQLQFRSYGVGYYTEFIVWRAQVEKGEVATDWSPAPEDIYALIDDIDAEHVGLDNVQNYGISSKSQAESGASNNTYMTPLRTKQAIDAQRPILIDLERADVSANYFPLGVSIMNVSDGVGREYGYPENYGVVVTYKTVDNRTSQEFIANGFRHELETSYRRFHHSNNDYSGWTPWKQAVYTDTDIGDDYILKKYSDGTFELKGHVKRTESLTYNINDMYRTGNLRDELIPIMDDSYKLIYSNAWIMDGYTNTFLVMPSVSNPLNEKSIRYRIMGNNASPTEDVEFTIGYEAYGTWS